MKKTTDFALRRSFLRLAAGAGSATLGAGLLAACGGGGGDGEALAAREGALTRTIGNCSSKSGAVVDAAGNTVGFIDFINSDSHISIQVFGPADERCTLGKMSLWVGTDLALLPVDAAGKPRYADLPHQADISDRGLRVYEFEIALSALGLSAGALNCSSAPVTVVVVGQIATACGSGTIQGYSGPNGNGTYTYATYELCCSDTPVLAGCETAFAKGGYVFASDAKANPEKLPSLKLSRSRWGWAINLSAPGTTRHDIYAGAGLNKTSPAKRVGSLTVSWDGSQATVTYSLVSGVSMTEAHLYAGDNKPTTIAPGQYGNTAYFSAPATSHSVTVPLADRNGDGVWLIAHAVVC